MRDVSPLANEALAASDVANRYWAARSANATKGANNIKSDNLLIAGVDVGQSVDHTAIILSEVEPRDDGAGNSKNHYVVRHIEKRPLKESYQSIVDRCASIYDALDKRVYFAVDIGGARPIGELYKAADIPILEIQIHGGTQSRIERGRAYVSKLELATLLQVISSANRIHLPKLSKHAPALRDELRRFELKITEAGNLTFSGEKRSHDDLVMALSYVLFYGERRSERTRRRRVHWL